MRLKDFRPHNVSLGDVAKKMDKARSTIQKMENSENPGIFSVKEYAEAVGVPPLQIVAGLFGLDEKSVQNA